MQVFPSATRDQKDTRTGAEMVRRWATTSFDNDKLTTLQVKQVPGISIAAGKKK
jgi:hypothetical protein